MNRCTPLTLTLRVSSQTQNGSAVVWPPRIAGQPAALVLELFSPPRTLPRFQLLCSGLGFKADGIALDLKIGWDADDIDNLRSMMHWQAEVVPEIVIASPPCTFFNRMQNLNRRKVSAQKRQALEVKAMHYLKIATTTCYQQVLTGGGFILEHPHSATSWSTDCVRELEHASPTAQRVTFDKASMVFATPMEHCFANTQHC